MCVVCPPFASYINVCEYSLVEERKQVSHDHECWPWCCGQDLADGEGAFIQTLRSCWTQGKSDVPCAQTGRDSFIFTWKDSSCPNSPGKPSTSHPVISRMLVSPFLTHTFPFLPPSCLIHTQAHLYDRRETSTHGRRRSDRWTSPWGKAGCPGCGSTFSARLLLS